MDEDALYAALKEGHLGGLLEEMPFPTQRIQTDRGLEFFAEAVQRRLMEWGIKFRPTKPRSPHLNGKVDPQAWLADVLRHIADHPASRLHELLPWHWKHRETPADAD